MLYVVPASTTRNYGLPKAAQSNRIPGSQPAAGLPAGGGGGSCGAVRRRAKHDSCGRLQKCIRCVACVALTAQPFCSYTTHHTEMDDNPAFS